MELLNSVSWTILSFIFVLGIMIFIHELGHYLMAKALGIRVEVFSLGFGPRLIGFRRGETDYRISLLPLGGFVKMTGENYDEELNGSRDEFLSRPKSHRFAVAIAGPLMNIGLAVVLLAVSYMVGIQVPKYLSETPVVGYVVSESPAEEAGLAEGDVILSIGSTETPTWETVHLVVATSPGQTVSVAVRREGASIERLVTLKEDTATGGGFLGLLPPVSNIITSVEAGPAKEAGLQSGDIIERVSAGEATETELRRVLDLIAASEGTPVEFTIRRDQEVFDRMITPEEIGGRARIGITIGELPSLETRTERYGLFPAVGRSLDRTYQLTALTFNIIGKLLTGETSIKMMSGPIEIAKYSGQAASQGPLALIGFMALVSLQLGIFNLFPIPILDGGVIALLGIEGLLGRDLSLKVKERIFQVGFVFLILLMSIVIFNDISKNI